MTFNDDLTTPQRSPRLRLAIPPWVERIISSGIVSHDPAVRRCQRFANIAAYAIGSDAVLHLFTNLARDFEGLLPVNIYNLLIATACFSMHRLHRFGDRLTANVLTVVALIGNSYAVFAFGLSSNLQVYFTMAGASLIFIGVPHWRNYLVLYALSLITLVVTMAFASEHGFVLPGDDAFRENLQWQAIISAFLLNAIFIAYVLVALDRAERDLQLEFDRAERLLTSILPASIAARLKSGREKRIADRLENVSVLFMDLVGFTPVAGAATPEEVVDYLHRLFSRFDTLCDEYRVDKIKTIGDSYMAAGGLDGRDREGALAIAQLAFAMRDCISDASLAGNQLSMRVGIHIGPVVAGVIGDRRLAYDVWGDTVNVASRMESSGAPGKVHVTEAYYRTVSDRFDFKSRGSMELKGAGFHRTGFLMEMPS